MLDPFSMFLVSRSPISVCESDLGTTRALASSVMFVLQIECAAYNPEPLPPGENQPDLPHTGLGFLWVRGL